MNFLRVLRFLSWSVASWIWCDLLGAIVIW